MNMRIMGSLLIVAFLAGSVAAVGCGDDDEGGGSPTTAPTTAAQPTSSTGGESVVDVTLREFEVVATPKSVAAGDVTFRAENMGPEDEHELVVIRTDLAPDALPTADDGSVPEEEVDIVDEIEPLAVGTSEELTIELTAGSYVLICNVVEEEEGATQSHYQNGMRTSLTVN